MTKRIRFLRRSTEAVRETNKALEYARSAVRKKTTPRYVKKQLKDFIRICEGKDKKYILSEKKLRQIENILKILIMPKGLKAGMTLYECTTGYQWVVYTASLCIVYRDDEKRRRYETVILEICRKNFKTYTVGTLFILLFLTEPKFSKFYSVAPDGALSREIREAISETIRSSPLIYEYKDSKRFKILRDYIQFKPTQTQFIPLSYSTSRMDGRLPNVFVCDEAGALPINYPIEAMRSGQLNILNKLGFVISTKYPTADNPFEDEVNYSKRVLDGIEKDETRFSLLYEPDKTTGWETDDLILRQANPVSMEIPEIWADLLKKRAYAIAVESARENFITKHCNIIYSGSDSEMFVNITDVQKCRAAKIDWSGRVVYVGIDLSETNDNTSVTMLAADEENRILCKSWAFIPEGRIEEKSAAEKVNYKDMIRSGNVIACGDRVIDYSAVEAFIMQLEEKYDVSIQAIGYDRWNALSTAQKLENEGYNLVEVKQHSSVLHPPTKLLKEMILSEKFIYEKNPLLEINYQNARCTYDTNRNLYLTKKKSKGKIDIVFSTLDALYVLQQDYLLNQVDFVVQII